MEFRQIAVADWGYAPADCTPIELISSLATELERAVGEYTFVGLECDAANNQPGFGRVSADIPVSAPLFDAFFNGPGGYRAQYAIGERTGEAFNQSILLAITPILASLPPTYLQGMDRAFCERSLAGSHTKVWFPKEITSVEYQEELESLQEVICWSPWLQWWAGKEVPRKGLLAPQPERTAILLNGTFVGGANDTEWDQKPYRSSDLHARGWT